ncbi:5'-methylthioadenosine/S-adenosylhomocysteine nucleosidase [Dactylosporangium sp. NPDC049140]|uniref:5'-methylthioadenosine/S-adenosylhomocysteine nucleosidase family protein n=1 Tax=Dactylosporangium sp. NPDC049140 TaxID=3155647 RepID=UPI003405F2FF
MQNDGVISTGDHNQIFNKSTIGPDATVRGAYGPNPATADRRPGRWQIGVITVIPAETRALHGLLDRAGPPREETHNGRRFREARLVAGDSPVAVVATQALGPGQRPAGAAYQHLRARYAPPVIVLVGIAGGIHPDVGLGDVVIGSRIVYYDSRREDPGETRFRGESHDVPPAVQHSINAFFTRHGEPAILRTRSGRRGETFRVLPGPIGSGEAVIRDDDSPARQWLRRYNDKTLATETEGAALAHAFHEDRDADVPPRGWLVIRGVSDHADVAKNDLHHDAASRNAVQTFHALLPYLT